MKEKLATLSFIVFLMGAFLYAYYSPPNRYSEDLDVLAQGRLWTGTGYDYNGDGMVDVVVYSHPYPLLGILIFKYIPKAFFLWIGPFALVASYLLIYYKVSKRIVYWYSLTVLNVLFLYTFTTRTFDWLLLPLVYDSVKKNRKVRAMLLGTLMVYIHGVIPLVYTAVLLAYLRRYDILRWVSLLSLPQILPLLYLTRGYYSFWSGVKAFSATLSVFGLSLNVGISNILFRSFAALCYLAAFMALVHEESRRASSEIS